MKKLMVALVAGAMAMGASAATMAWSVDWAYSNNGSDIYTFDDGGLFEYWIVSLPTASTEGLSVNAEGTLVLGTGMVAKYNDSFDTTGGGALEDLGFANNGDPWALVIYDADNGLYGVSDVAYVAGFTDPGEGQQQPSTVTMVFSNDGGLNADETPYMMANLAVAPEPTSGLLLLLGVAGLALRRRRA